MAAGARDMWRCRGRGDTEAEQGEEGGGKLTAWDAPPAVHCSDHLPELRVWDLFKRVLRKWQLKCRHVGFPGE